MSTGAVIVNGSVEYI